MSAGRAAASPTVARLRPQLQPCTLRTPITSRDRAPGEGEVEEAAEDPVAGPPVGAAGAEEVLAVDRDPERPEREQRERERRAREREQAAAPAGSCRGCRSAGPRRREARRRSSRRRARRRAPPRKAQTGISDTENEASLRRCRATGVPSTAAIPASPTIAMSGSCRASTAASDSSRSEAKTARGATSTAGARSHQLRSSAEGRAGVSALATAVTRPRPRARAARAGGTGR